MGEKASQGHGQSFTHGLSKTIMQLLGHFRKLFCWIRQKASSLNSSFLSKKRQELHMNYRPLGRTGIQLSQLCLGTMLYGSRTPEAEAVVQVDAALDAGINFIDTANVYNRGRSEEIVGKALARDG